MSIDQNTVILVVGAIAVAYILIEISKKIVKFIAVCAVLLVGFYFWQGGTVQELKEMGVETLFREKDLAKLPERYCAEDDATSLKCQCIVQPVYADLTSRLSPGDFEKLAQNDDLRKKELQQSLKNVQKQIKDCVVKNKGAEYWEGLKGAIEELKAVKQ